MPNALVGFRALKWTPAVLFIFGTDIYTVHVANFTGDSIARFARGEFPHGRLRF